MSNSKLMAFQIEREQVIHHSDTKVDINPRLPRATTKVIKQYLCPIENAATMVIIPTSNAEKTKAIMKYFYSLPPNRLHDIHFEVVSVGSGVGEQPYDQAGGQGAENRITNAVVAFAAEKDNLDKLRCNQVGHLYVAAIENFIWLNDLENIQTAEELNKAVDFGVVALHNVISGQTNAGMSSGVTISKHFIDEAREKGFDNDDQTYGRTTVGQCIAAKHAGVDKANWHKDLAGVSRYDLLEQALRSLTLPE